MRTCVSFLMCVCVCVCVYSCVISAKLNYKEMLTSQAATIIISLQSNGDDVTMTSSTWIDSVASAK